MIGLILVFAVIVLSLLVIRVATTMLVLTGMSSESSRFQARSAFTGVGFTTSEAEAIVGHPVRRRIVMTLMLLGSAGIVTAVASVIVSFGGASREQGISRALILLAALGLLLLLARSPWFDRTLSRAITKALRARGLDARDYAALLRFGGGYTVGELEVEPRDWLAGRKLAELRLRDEGVLVLGIHRDGDYTGVPGKETRVESGDVLVLYGHEDRLEELDTRRRDHGGDAEHARASAARSSRHVPSVAALTAVDAAAAAPAQAAAGARRARAPARSGTSAPSRR
jgi:hypothetical protein